LDRREDAFKGGESGRKAIEPGQPNRSHLIRLVDGSDPELSMPPRKGESRPLDARQIELLRRWVGEGAPWPEESSARGGGGSQAGNLQHWSFRPLQAVAPPSSKGNPVDGFVGAQLEGRQMSFSPEASRRELIRRLTYDLTGLPPSEEETRTFAADTTVDAYDRLVDRLLSSPRYGERWARHWLDVVHFGETHGYDKDQPRRNAWPYRDYVIRALNSDKPYDRFVREQIAGDELYPNTVDGITALGFLAAGPWDLIGHAEVPETKVDGKIARHLDRDDMVSTTVSTFLSLTVHCAQCHDHKFDPVSQRDYYALQSVFAAIDRTEVDYYADESVMQKYGEQKKQKRILEGEIGAIEAGLIAKCRKDYEALTKRIEEASKTLNPNERPESGYHSALSPTQDEEKWVQVDLGRTIPIRRIVLKPCYDDFAKIGAGFGFPVRFKIEVSEDPDFRGGVTLLRERHEETFVRDFPNPGLQPFEIKSATEGEVAGRYVRVTAVKLAHRSKDYMLALAEMEVYGPEETKNVAAGKPVAAKDGIESGVRWRRSNLTDGVAPVLRRAEERERLVREREALLMAQADGDVRAVLVKKRGDLAALPEVPAALKVYAGAVHSGNGNFKGTGASGGQPRPIHVLRRGDVKKPLDEVSPGAVSELAVAFGIPFEDLGVAGEGARRVALANWIANHDNALTWRSIVNRVWQFHFGRGIVETANDFGKMGALPSHPELLDWLAVWFRDEAKGSLKQLHRLIVTSRTYRQTSSPDLSATRRAEEIDSGNTLLWRQNRRRLEAEAIRDSVLFVSGKLDLSMGGPSFQDFVIEKPTHSPHYEYHLADPEDAKLHRRSVYRFLVRSQLQPWMATLDCADPSMLVDRRNITITPLQALAQLNNPLMVVMAKHFANRVSGVCPGETERVREAFRLALQRQPSREELENLSQHARTHGLPHACRLLFNLNEFVFVD
jgi:hypothetical protein